MFHYLFFFWKLLFFLENIFLGTVTSSYIFPMETVISPGSTIKFTLCKHWKSFMVLSLEEFDS